MKTLEGVFTICAWLFCPFACMAYQCEQVGLTSPPGWIWKAAEGDDFFQTYIFTFKENGTLLMQESLPGGKFDQDITSYRLVGKVLKVTFHSGFLKGKEIDMPCNFFNGQLQLTSSNGETYVFDPKTD